MQNYSIPKERKRRAEVADIVYELEHRWDYVGRKSQQEPPGEWDVWAIIAGRGFGKTRTGSETVRKWSDQVPSVLLMGATATDMRDIMVEGPSGILATSHKDNYPNYEPSKLRLTWPNGSVCHLRSADEPDRVRGIETYRGWFDEFAAWRDPQMCWDMIQMAVRQGDTKKLITTTPRPIDALKKIIKDGRTVTVRGSTFDNKANLSKSFMAQIVDRYEGTRIGRQELYAEILEDVEGALWHSKIIDHISEAPEMKRIVVAIDPAVTSKKTSNETGIIVCGLGIDGHGYILHDGSGRFTPSEWAERAISLHYKWEADRVVAEVNNGGDLVEVNVRSADPAVPYKDVRASRGKVTRAEPVVALYEKGKVHHVGKFPKLEEQMTTWDAANDPSPDRIDAMVWGITELMLQPEIDTNIWT